jgi:hypothetical protein
MSSCRPRPTLVPRHPHAACTGPYFPMLLASNIYIESTMLRNGSSQQRLHYVLLLIKLITHSPVAVARINSNNTDRRKKLRMTTSPRRKCPAVRNHMEDSSKMADESPLRRTLYRYYIQETLPKVRRDSCLHLHAVSDKKPDRDAILQKCVMKDCQQKKDSK